jgi:hypothetical protein
LERLAEVGLLTDNHPLIGFSLENGLKATLEHRAVDR